MVCLGDSATSGSVASTQETTWIVLGSANGSTNLGDESMWEAAVAAVRNVLGPVRIVTDGPVRWNSPLDNVVVLPNLALTLRRSSIIPIDWTSSALMRFVERVVSRPRRNAYARRAAARALRKPWHPSQHDWFNAIKYSDGLVISGAGAINDDYSPHGVSSWGLIVQWAKQLGTPVAIVGQGIGPLTHDHDRKSVAKMLGAAELVTVRERGSQQLVAKLSSTSIVPKVTPDWALTIVPMEDDRALAAELHNKLFAGNPFLVVSVHRRHTTSRRVIDKLALTLEGIVKSARDRGMQTLFVSNMTAEGYSDDRETAQLLIRRWSSENRANLIIQSEPMTPRVTRALLARASGLVATRYHPMVFAFAEGTPCVGISYDSYYDQKLGGLSELFSVSGNVHRLHASELEPSSVLDLLRTQVVAAVDSKTLDEVRAPLITFLGASRNKPAAPGLEVVADAVL